MFLQFSQPGADFSVPQDGEALLALLKREGMTLLKGRSFWLSFLPEIAERGLYRRAGHSTLTAYANHEAGITAEMVRRVMRVWRSIGKRHPILWSELRRGASLRKLETICATVRNSKQAKVFAQRIKAGWTHADLTEACRQERQIRSPNSMREKPATPWEGTVTRPIRLRESDASLLERLHKEDGGSMSLGEYVGSLLRARAAARIEQKVQGKTEVTAVTPRGRRPTVTLPKLGTTLRYVQVVHVDKDTRTCRIRTAAGSRIIRSEEVAASLEVGPPIELSLLRDRSLVAAALSKGEAIPTLIRRYVELRSQGRCEADGCSREANSIHHDTRRAWKLDHHPDRLVNTCRAHHDYEHVTGTEQSETPNGDADEAFLHMRAAA